ncbi:AtpZ/AtpI family protein [Chengkuizengella axinellae]|uniref:AtpZ/AtpI family protein n=1 Tax=Chengkuizengella axinellae TaxID=3064388 RepID=A0ABT9J5B9_9BACL|nr:AtpZ/AtpI family protein [Chengkuizengella sp. 2205SS18-9]MDP5276820.1 AtpZ/AtpI family protein [Chengkuizengella sp. 2205SS18-9]
MSRSNDNPWKAFALVGIIGLDIAICMLAGYWLGNIAVNYLYDNPICIVVGIMLGFAVGVFNVILIIRRYMGVHNE